jgi:hypothetical protein
LGIADEENMGYVISDELREKKRLAGKAGSKARMETIQRAKEAKRIAADKSMDEAGLQAELTKLREELGVISYQQKAINEGGDPEKHVPGSTKYTEFIDLGETVLSGIIWSKKYPQTWDDLQEKYTDDEDGNHVLKEVKDRAYFNLAPDCACERMMGIAHYEYELPVQLQHFMIKVFERFLEWAGTHLKERLDYLPDIAEALADLRAGKTLFNQVLHDKVQREDLEHQQQFDKDRQEAVKHMIHGRDIRDVRNDDYKIGNLPSPDPMVAGLSPSYVPPVLARNDFYDSLPAEARDFMLHGGRRR